MHVFKAIGSMSPTPIRSGLRSARHSGAGSAIAGRSASLSYEIITDVRHALIEQRLKPGDVLGTEKDLAAQYDVSRIVARDALRTLQALGIAEIRMGKGGGARVAHGNAQLFAEALAIQLDLIGVTAGEIIDAQRAIETLAIELAAENATPHDIARLDRLLVDSRLALDDGAAFTRLSREFHLAITEASHNRVLVVQLISLQHVAWPTENRTLTTAVARRVLAVHVELAGLIAMRDGAGARRLMDEHVRMIRSRRVKERAEGSRSRPAVECC